MYFITYGCHMHMINMVSVTTTYQPDCFWYQNKISSSFVHVLYYVWQNRTSLFFFNCWYMYYFLRNLLLVLLMQKYTNTSFVDYSFCVFWICKICLYWQSLLVIFFFKISKKAQDINIAWSVCALLHICPCINSMFRLYDVYSLNRKPKDFSELNVKAIYYSVHDTWRTLIDKVLVWSFFISLYRNLNILIF